MMVKVLIATVILAVLPAVAQTSDIQMEIVGDRKEHHGAEMRSKCQEWDYVAKAVLAETYGFDKMLRVSEWAAGELAFNVARVTTGSSTETVTFCTARVFYNAEEVGARVKELHPIPPVSRPPGPPADDAFGLNDGQRMLAQRERAIQEGMQTGPGQDFGPGTPQWDRLEAERNRQLNAVAGLLAHGQALSAGKAFASSNRSGMLIHYKIEKDDSGEELLYLIGDPVQRWYCTEGFYEMIKEGQIGCLRR